MKSLLIIFAFLITVSVSAQTTYILIRHAEKENSKDDPNLTKEGEARANLLAFIFEKQKVDAIYSTNFNRTKNTVKPLADAKGIEVQIYEKQPDLSKAKGTVVIVGHSNTIPALANALLGKEQFKTFDDSDFGNLLVITGTSVTHFRY
jgi:broad specificity phosphatase PhoE